MGVYPSFGKKPRVGTGRIRFFFFMSSNRPITCNVHYWTGWLRKSGYHHSFRASISYSLTQELVLQERTPCILVIQVTASGFTRVQLANLLF